MLVSHKCWPIFVFIFTLIGSYSSVIHSKEKKDAPLTISGTVKVSAEDIFELIEKIPNLIIIDARIPSDRIQGYLESSISLPDTETNCDSLKKLFRLKNLRFYFIVMALNVAVVVMLLNLH